MGLSGNSPRDAGLATPAAILISLALAIVASAAMELAVMDLRATRAEQARVTAEYALDGAQRQVALQLLTTRPAARLQWTLASTVGPVSILAEYQPAKLGLAAAAELDGETLRRLGVLDAAALGAHLTALAGSSARASDFAVAGTDPAPLWRSCGRSLISPYGQARTPPPAVAAAPPEDQGEVIWRIGEVWRLRARSPDGWADDRIVRFTGEPLHPAAVIERRLARGGDDPAVCDARLFPDAAAAAPGPSH